MEIDKNTVIFTDGASRGNPGPGGWGAIVVQNSKLKTQNEAQVMELGGAEKNTTNNRMELTAALEGLKQAAKHLNGGEVFVVYTDSSYLVNGATKWLAGWKRNGWKTQTKTDVLNKDMWVELDKAVSDLVVHGVRVDWKYIGGHVGVSGNERCDEIATKMADGIEESLYDGPLSGYKIRNIFDVSHDEALVVAKKSDSSRSRARAYSYVSAVNGSVMTHATWADCEKRVKGVKGARFKKALDAEEERKIMEEFKKA
ncbi:MAG: viroplasmin family protein [Patescibacteria group bacterium]|nr:viroplasmin family protein [Patescibacteria group bacterium]